MRNPCILLVAPPNWSHRRRRTSGIMMRTWLRSAFDGSMMSLKNGFDGRIAKKKLSFLSPNSHGPRAPAKKRSNRPAHPTFTRWGHWRCRSCLIVRSRPWLSQPGISFIGQTLQMERFRASLKSYLQPLLPLLTKRTNRESRVSLDLPLDPTDTLNGRQQIDNKNQRVERSLVRNNLLQLETPRITKIYLLLTPPLGLPSP